MDGVFDAFIYFLFSIHVLLHASDSTYARMLPFMLLEQTILNDPSVQDFGNKLMCSLSLVIVIKFCTNHTHICLVKLNENYHF